MKITELVGWFHDGHVESIHHDIENRSPRIVMCTAQIIDWPEFDLFLDGSWE